MRGTFSAAGGRLVLAGTFTDTATDIALHRHPVVQIAVGLTGPVEFTTDTLELVGGRVVVVAAGARHALRAKPGTDTLSVYLRPGCRAGSALNTVCRSEAGHRGIWVPADHAEIAADVAATVGRSDLRTAADTLQERLIPTAGAEMSEATHPHLQRALEQLGRLAPGDVDLQSVARAVALSPDYLGRLVKRQTGVSFSSIARWLRLLVALRHLDRGASVTDAAHLAGFADGAHANRVCREFSGMAPSAVARALTESQPR